MKLFIFKETRRQILKIVESKIMYSTIIENGAVYTDELINQGIFVSIISIRTLLNSKELRDIVVYNAHLKVDTMLERLDFDEYHKTCVKATREAISRVEGLFHEDGCQTVLSPAAVSDFLALFALTDLPLGIIFANFNRRDFLCYLSDFLLYESIMAAEYQTVRNQQFLCAMGCNIVAAGPSFKTDIFKMFTDNMISLVHACDSIEYLYAEFASLPAEKYMHTVSRFHDIRTEVLDPFMYVKTNDRYPHVVSPLINRRINSN